MAELTFSDRVNTEAQRAREALDVLRVTVRSVTEEAPGLVEVYEALVHLENARLRILDFARKEADA